MITFNSILGRIMYELGEPVHITFRPEELFEYTKEGAALLYKLVSTLSPKHLLKKDTTLHIDANTSTVQLPTDLLALKYLYLKSQTINRYRCIPTDIETLNEHADTSGTPLYFSRIGTTLELAPVPDIQYDIILYYLPKYTAPNVYDDSIGIPDEFVEFVVDYVVIRAKNRSDRNTIVEQNFINLKLNAIKSVLYSESEEIQVKGTLFESHYFK